MNLLVEFVAARGHAEPDRRRLENFQKNVGQKFHNVLAVETDLNIKQQLRQEFEWLVSEDFIQFFTEKYREIKWWPGLLEVEASMALEEFRVSRELEISR